jgi:hypothetical protein
MNSAKPSLLHLKKLMGPFGLYQHATFTEPLLSEGYCTDDNARAVSQLLRWQNIWPEDSGVVEDMLARCWQYVVDARRGDGTYYNFRDAAGTWLPHDISEDMYARLARMFVDVVKLDSNQARRDEARQSLEQLLPLMQTFVWPRAVAEGIIALSQLPDWSRAQEVRATLADKLYGYWGKNASPSWPWFEETMTYANALLPQAAAIESSTSPKWKICAEESTSFLIASTIHKDVFSPIGNKGWHTLSGERAQEDQQPIEASTTLDFLLAYNQLFPEKLPADTIIAPYLWFFGGNLWQQMIADLQSGASQDGLSAQGVNANCGAESTLAYLTCEVLIAGAPEHIRQLAWQKRSKQL